ncbi:hypothetical protein T440DRAFT_499542 [Plenodomus tracheiphilus IPT5]|uniref:Uncharacterized protein n=1 Tax=Plenodomus tracheiphilus IPT5 TaxID=1408161 RepID=A0A6A7B4L0_9PLEO|nr:hypothetical protein T440DRAFT_499542 [Plenodomus tracheiphilus IPT5]
MAEALAMLGLASNIISFIDFGLKVSSGAKTIRDSLHGTTNETRELELILEDVKSYGKKISDQKDSGVKLSSSELLILAMVKECKRLAADLEHAIKALRIREGRSNILEVGRVAFQTVWKQKDIDALRTRLENLDRRLRSSVENILQNEQHSTVSAKLDAIRKAQESMEINYDAKLDVIQKEIIRTLKQERLNNTTSQVAQLASLKTKLDTLEKEQHRCLRQNKIIKSLHFPVISKRWSTIPTADQFSNEWIFDTTLTTFKNWLESSAHNDNTYCITGRAGSGKSTLMKFASESSHTQDVLLRWASPARLCTASFYFWNQGYEMQKNQIGLFQSLIYQILKSAPTLVQMVCPEHLDHEDWSIEELKAAFKRIAAQTDLEVRYCFFIDGLDEYNGPEEEIIEVLKFLSLSNSIKICASTRPRSVFETFFSKSSRRFDIANFTKNDMTSHVRRELHGNEKFQILEKENPQCKEILGLIADLAQGVWLWVFLVTRDIRIAVNRDEGVDMLRKIVHQFPADLERYFKRIIESVRPQYLEEMSQIFLITVDELQPLPLYAFALLEEERKDPSYAINAPIRPVQEAQILEKYPVWKSLVQNRCSDLLLVDDDPHPLFLSHSVDFLHRTVRDFLQDNYYSKLTENLKSDFDSTASLAKICLAMLKSLPGVDFGSTSSRNKIIGLTDELLYYAHETEKRSESSESTLIPVLDELDRVNSFYSRGVRNHWTQARDSVAARGLDEYREGDTYNFLALTIQARLVKYVRHKLDCDSRVMKKGGRPLLDYALRPRRATAVSMPYHSRRDDSSVDIAMVQMLLEHGADPNQPVYLNDGRTVWALFLLSIHESAARAQGGTSGANVTTTLETAWLHACELLIEFGAKADCFLVRHRPELTIWVIFEGAFGPARTATLRNRMAEIEAERTQPWSACMVM